MIILDSDIVTLLSYGHEKIRARMSHAVRANEELAVTVITFMEILRGRFESITKAATAEVLLVAMQRFKESVTLLNDFRQLEIDQRSTRHFSDLTKRKKGPKLKRGDLLIACVALAHDATLITRNLKDFQQVNGLRLDNWAD